VQKAVEHQKVPVGSVLIGPHQKILENNFLHRASNDFTGFVFGRRHSHRRHNSDQQKKNKRG
jgi:hypothetical protein